MDPAAWKLTRRDGRLHMDGVDLVGLADAHGTPLHVASAATLRARCAELRSALSDYPATVRLHFSYKTNMVAGVLQVLTAAGMGAEVVSAYELWLTRRLGLQGEQIVVNGPNKSDEELAAAIDADVGLLVVDNLAELHRVETAAAAAGRVARIGLRICPDVVPRGMNASSVTGSRRNQFGMDIDGDELTQAIATAAGSDRLRLRGVMAHIGSGIHDVSAYKVAVDRLLGVQQRLFAAGATPDLLDLGGGLGTRLSREFTTLEMLAYIGFGRLPKALHPAPADLPQRYGRAVVDAVTEGCRRRELPVPTLVLEPGRALVSDAQVLLLRVGATRHREGIGHFALTDGGAMTVSMMFLSELHAVFLANREGEGDDLRRTNVFGRLPSPMDVVYRNLRLPALQVGDLLAVMDAGAYFTSTSTNFGGCRPAVVLVDDGEGRLVRRRVTPDDLAACELVLAAEEPA